MGHDGAGARARRAHDSRCEPGAGGEARPRLERRPLDDTSGPAIDFLGARQRARRRHVGPALRHVRLGGGREASGGEHGTNDPVLTSAACRSRRPRSRPRESARRASASARAASASPDRDLLESEPPDRDLPEIEDGPLRLCSEWNVATWPAARAARRAQRRAGATCLSAPERAGARRRQRLRPDREAGRASLRQQLGAHGSK